MATARRERAGATRTWRSRARGRALADGGRLSNPSCRPAFLADRFAEQAGGPEEQDDDENDEGEDVAILRADGAARQARQQAGAEGLEQAEQEAAEHGAGDAADAAEDRRGEGLQADDEAHAEDRHAIVAGIEQPGDRAEAGADEEDEADRCGRC